ncbi:hypothetical protein [Kitasatospora viridis]|uniref:DUF5666 domain-containing protein n=1 Tax=Kitasatospora viridis TaxID=281105 RepID=A0A561UH68_9ACTN|nr:hypothetical protein [Kitasatospora viridis]TWF98685.1 hypothetical protein FHX73_112506 [Kitasatospora viridis]
MATNNSDLVRSDDTMRLPVVPAAATLSAEAMAQAELLATPPDARDIGAELAAPPRRKLPWLTLLLAGGVIAAGAFAGGAWYQKNDGASNSANSGRSAIAAALQKAGAGQAGGRGKGTGASGQAGGGSGGFTRGTVKLVDGSTVYLTDANGNIVKVTTGGSTKVSVTQDGKVSDLQPGQSVTVVGTPDGSGGYTASQLTEGGSAAGGAGGFGGGGFGGGGFGGAAGG